LNQQLKAAGIKTSLDQIQLYLNGLCTVIKGPYKQDFLRNINTPLGQTTTEKLSNMHAYDYIQSESSIEISTGFQQAILDVNLYLQIENQISENEEKNDVAAQLEHIHNKMLFDSFNETLDSFRPYGLKGQPYPWKSNIKVAAPKPITEENMDKILEKAKEKVIEWSSSMCGFFGDKEDQLLDKTSTINEEFLAQLREERLARMLASDVFEMEERWITYDDEEAEVQVELADLIFDKLVTETVEVITQINEERRKNLLKM